jgi:DNA replication protein DnaC
VKLKTQWAHFPYNKGLDQFDCDFQPSIDERKMRELAGLAFLERRENVLFLGRPESGRVIWRSRWAPKPPSPATRSTSSPCRI